MQNILFPTDFSENAYHAAEYAGFLANQMDANISFLHIFSVPLVSEYNLPHEIENFIAQNRIKAVEDLKVFVQRFILETKISENRISQRIEYGFVPEKIVAISNEIASDMIVMGTKGAANYIDRLIGTVTQKVVKKATCPVMIISEKSFIHFPKSILYAADFEGDELAATQKLVSITKQLDGKCNIVHVNGNFELNVGHQIDAMADYLVGKFEEDEVAVKVIKNDNVIEGLEKYLRTFKPDVIAIAIHDKSIFDKLFESSVSNHFILDANLPILCFKK
jgi:nucleotide-binding universal stress UspA family protein